MVGKRAIYVRFGVDLPATNADIAATNVIALYVMCNLASMLSVT